MKHRVGERDIRSEYPEKAAVTGGGCNPPGEYGGGSGQVQTRAGGAGGYATPGESSRNGNGGRIHGNGENVPLAGGSGGASGNPQMGFACSGDGGGGGGALALSAAFCDVNLLTSNGAQGQDGRSGDGGSGSGGAVMLQCKLPSLVWKITAQGGTARGPDGGAGRIRMDGPLGWTSSGLPADESLFFGPSTDTSRYVPKSFILTGTGNGERIALYLKSERMPWTQIETLTGYGQQWSATITLPAGEGLYFLTAVQEIPNPSSDRYTAQPVELLSQAAANIFIYKAFPVIASDRARTLPTLLCEQEAYDTLYVRNDGDADLLLQSASFQNPAAGFTLESPSAFPVTVAAGDSTAVITHFVPPYRPGLFLDTLLIGSNDTSAARNPWSIRFDATAELASFVASTDSVVFQDLILCERSFTDTVITLTNNGSVPITIEAPIISGSMFTLEDPPMADFPLTIPAGGILDIRLRFSSSSTGPYFGAVDFTSDSLGCDITQTVWLHSESFDAALVSDSSIVFPSLLCPGDMTDTTVVITNTGDYPVNVTTVSFSGSGFTLLSPLPPFIAPGGFSTPVRIRFAPAASGTYRSVLRFEGSPCDLWTETVLTGTKDSLGFQTASIDFGLVAPGDFPVTQTGVLRNTGTVPIIISTPAPSGAFEVIAGLPATLQPGDSVVVTVQFSDPGADGNYSVRIDLPHDPTCMPVDLPVTGSRGTASLILAIDTVGASAGDFLDIAVYLRNRQNVRLFGATTISTELRLNKTLLVPQFSPPGIVQGNDRIIPLLVPLVTDENDVALLLRFQATLGNAESSSLTFENTKAVDGDLEIVEEHGYFSLLDICREGGSRLFNDGGSVDLAPNKPNPFNPVTEIAYEIIEYGKTRLVVSDRLGRSVAVLVDEYLQPGRYSVLFDGSHLPSGTYLYMLQTPTQIRMRKMLLLK